MKTVQRFGTSLEYLLFNIFVRYTADDDGYRADVSYLVNKNSELNYGPPPPKSKIISSKIKPLIIEHSQPVFLHHPKDQINELSLEERKTISAKATYIVSHKSTHISDDPSDEVIVHQNSNIFV